MSDGDSTTRALELVHDTAWSTVHCMAFVGGKLEENDVKHARYRCVVGVVWLAATAHLVPEGQWIRIVAAVTS